MMAVLAVVYLALAIFAMRVGWSGDVADRCFGSTISAGCVAVAVLMSI